MAAFDFVPGMNVKPMGSQQINNASLNAAVGLIVPTLDKANAAIIQNDPLVSTQAVRYRDDGTDPDANTGMVLSPGESISYLGDLSAIKFIRVATGAQLNVLLYRFGRGGE